MKQRVTENIAKAIVLTVCSATLFCTTSALAAENNVPGSVDLGCQEISQQSVIPLYAGLVNLNSILDIDSRGYALCEASADADLNYTCNAPLELQQKSEKSWKTIKKWSSSGRKNYFLKGVYVTSGHDYRLKISADVYNSSGKLVESPTDYSTVVHY